MSFRYRDDRSREANRQKLLEDSMGNQEPKNASVLQNTAENESARPTCICDRPMVSLICKSCKSMNHGRIQRVCNTHPNVSDDKAVLAASSKSSFSFRSSIFTISRNVQLAEETLEKISWRLKMTR